MNVVTENMFYIDRHSLLVTFTVFIPVALIKFYY